MTDNGAGLGQRPRPGPLVCFCDIDGTLVHYPDEQEKWGSYTGSSVVPGCVMWVEKVSKAELPPASPSIPANYVSGVSANKKVHSDSKKR